MQVFGSPFEADAQCSHLVRLGIADAADTTDSDLYTFGCPLTLYRHFSSSRKPGAMVRLGASCSSDINNMTPIEVVWMTCLCGCDYINNLHGCGMAKALQTVQSWRGKSPEVLSAVRYHPSLTHTLNQTATLLPSDLTTTPTFGSLSVPTGMPQGDGTCWKVAENSQPRPV